MVSELIGSCGHLSPSFPVLATSRAPPPREADRKPDKNWGAALEPLAAASSDIQNLPDSRPQQFCCRCVSKRRPVPAPRDGHRM